MKVFVLFLFPIPGGGCHGRNRGHGHRPDPVFVFPGFLVPDTPVAAVCSRWMASHGAIVPEVSTPVPSIAVIRSMMWRSRRSWPSRTDACPVTITPKTSIENLRMERYEIDRQGHDASR